MPRPVDDGAADHLEGAARPYRLLSDSGFELARALSLPTFELDGSRHYSRLTLIARDRIVRAVFYPVFPPDRNAADVVGWLAANPQ